MITARLRQIARCQPGAVAVIADDLQLSYAELLSTAAGIWSGLEHAGARPGGIVMVPLRSGWQAIGAFVACADAGAIFMPVSPSWTTRELSWLIGRVNPAAVVIDRDDERRWAGTGVASERFVFADRFALATFNEPDEPSAGHWPDDHPAAYLTTSGSTGRPRIVPRTHGMVTRAAAASATASGCGPGRRLLAPVPFHHGGGFSNSLCLPLLTGATVVLVEQFQPLSVAAAIERWQVDWLWSSPAVFRLLVDSNVPASSLRSLQACWCGGAPLAADVVKAWNVRCDAPIRQCYGSTETGLVALQTEDAPEGCVGVPVPGTEIRILNEGEEVSSGRKGEIGVGGPGVFTGYHDETRDNAGRFWKQFFRTGDLGALDERGRLYLCGRLEPRLNVGGVKVDPNEVRGVITLMNGVRACMLDAEPGPRGVDVIAATIVVEPGVEISRANVLRHCRQHLAEFKIPRRLRFHSASSADPTGKTPRPWGSRTS
jgi:acyl-CoA synthetase (AMP-forming)/AMP-acid ligase II